MYVCIPRNVEDRDMKFTPKTHQLRGYPTTEWEMLAADMGGNWPILIRDRSGADMDWCLHQLRPSGRYYLGKRTSDYDLIPRAIPHNIPDNLPEAILCVAMDGDGLVYGWHNEEPCKGKFTWYGGDAMPLPQWAYGPILDGWDWKESLHKRNDEGKWVKV